MSEMVAASEAAASVGEAGLETEGAGEVAVEETEGREAGEVLGARDAMRIDDVALASEDLWQAGQIEGWSLEGLGQSANEVLATRSVETEPLIGSGGEVTEWVRPEEKAHYDEIGLRPQEVGGRECLVRDDINWTQTDSYGQTNLERAEQGLAPLDREGNPFTLHHVQQRDDGVLAELTKDEHQGKEIDGILHDKGGPSEIDREAFNQIRKDHWMERAAEARRELAP